MTHITDKQMGVRHQRGFSLIEALFSALILAVALLGLAGFHAVALQDGTLIKARSVAANLAQEKLDDLRGFTRLQDDALTTTVNECAAPTFCFTEIAADAGGRERTAGNLVLPSGAVPGYIDNYSIAWTVTCATEAAGSALAFGGTCTGATAKLATVTVSWTDSKGQNQLVSLQGVVYAMDPLRLALGTASAFSSQKPKAGYVPVGVPDAVPVPINTGGTQFKESSKPLPEVSQSGTGIEVSFDSVIYSTSGGGYQKDSQEEFSTVGCECEFVSGTNTGYTPTRKIWNGNQLVTKVGEGVTKATGAPLGNNPPSHCDVCCRDHHDRTANDPKYDPQRPTSDYTTGGDHKHYWYSQCVSGGSGAANCTNNDKNSSLGSGTPLAEVTSGAYLESCRVARVDGFWRVQQDWQLRKVTILPYDFLLNTTNLNNYVNMVEEVVENAVKTDSGATGVSITPLSGRDLTLPSGAAAVQLLSRAVYVDTIYHAEDDPGTTGVNELNTIDTGYYTALLTKLAASQSASNSAWLEFAPFYEANLTKLFDWTSSDAGIATVSSEPIDAIYDPVNAYYASFSRGSVTVQSGTTAGTSTITSRARLANSGVTGGVNRTSGYVPGVSYGTDADDNASANTTTDTITVTRPAAGTSHSISGKVMKGNGSVNVAETGSSASPITATLNTTSGSVISACAPLVGDSDPNAWLFSCTVSNGWTGTLTLSSTGSVYTFNDPTSTTFVTPSMTNVSGVIGVSPVVAYGGTVTLTGQVTDDNYPTSGGVAPDVTATSTTITYSGTASGTCSNKVVSGSGSNQILKYSCVVPKGWTGAISIAVDPTGGAYTYLSPGGTPCTGSTTGSCTLATVTSALADIDGTSTSATLAQQQQTNVEARR